MHAAADNRESHRFSLSLSPAMAWRWWQEGQKVLLCPLTGVRLSAVQVSHAKSVVRRGRYCRPSACASRVGGALCFVAREAKCKGLGPSPASGGSGNLVPGECRPRRKSEQRVAGSQRRLARDRQFARAGDPCPNQLHRSRRTPESPSCGRDPQQRASQADPATTGRYCRTRRRRRL
jgi:hypothetical protein